MGRVYYLFLFITIFLSVIVNSAKVSATSWENMEPQVVSEKAEVIVTGKYDFSSKPKSTDDFIFHGFRFEVKRIYKGNAPKQLTVGIDMHDVGWATEFQNKGGEFLLFLEKSEEVGFLVPVGGPNGMVQIVNGQVEGTNDEKRMFYEDVLKSKSKTPNKNMETKEQGKSSRSFVLIYVSVGIIAGGVIYLLINGFLKKH